jgi:hypothetical protein
LPNEQQQIIIPRGIAVHHLGYLSQQIEEEGESKNATNDIELENHSPELIFTLIAVLCGTGGQKWPIEGSQTTPKVIDNMFGVCRVGDALSMTTDLFDQVASAGLREVLSKPNRTKTY